MVKVTRVRYRKLDPDMLASQDMLGDTMVYRSVIRTDTRTVAVERLVNEAYEVVHAKTYDSLAEAKASNKMALKALGVTFYDEVRNKKVKAIV